MFDLSLVNIVKGKKTTAAGIILGALVVYLTVTDKAELSESIIAIVLALYLLGVADPKKKEKAS